MIYYSVDKINDWNYGADNLIKVYRDGYVAYYKIVSGSSSGQTPCFAVVDDINDYSSTEFVDVYDKATSKWYKLNNLNEFEEYGVYADTTGGTYYDGKLAIVGTISRLPNGYTEVEYVENTGSSSVNLNLALNESTSNTYEITFDNTMEWTSGGEDYQTFLCCKSELGTYPGWYYRFNNSGQLTYSNWISLNRTTSGSAYHNVITCNSVAANQTSDYPLNLFSALDTSKAPFRYCKGRLYNMQVTLNNSLVRNLVPCKRNSDNEYGLYDLVNDVFYASATNAKLTGGAALPTNADEYEYSGGSWNNVGAVSGGEIPDSTVIEFEDANVKTLCVNAFGGNVVAGELTYGEAKQVTSLGTVFKGQTSIRKFNEFCYFTGMQSVDHADFSGCTNLNEIVIPTSVRSIGIYDASQRHRIPFSGCPNLSAITYLPSSQSISISQTSRESEYYRQQSASGTPMVYPNREIIALNGMISWKTYMSNVYFQSPNLPIDKEVIVANLESEPYNCKNIYCPIGSYQTYYNFFGQYPGRTVTEYDFESDPNNVLAKVRTWSGKTVGDITYPVYYAAKQAPPIVVDFQTVAEMEAYECPYVGLVGYVSTDRYVFADNYEWVMSAQTPCYAVTDDISQYSSTEFEDVFDKTTSKWYKLNNLNEFEEYGVYANTTGGTHYEGKLAIDDGYEYVYSGSSWVSVGETSGSVVERIWYDPAAENSLYSIGHYWGEGYRMVFNCYLSGSYSSDSGSFWRMNNQTPIEFSFYSNGFYLDGHYPTSTEEPTVYTGDNNWRVMKTGVFSAYENSQILNLTIKNGYFQANLESTGAFITSGSASVSPQNWYNGLYQANINLNGTQRKCHLSSIKVYNANDELVNDIKFIKNPNVTGAQELSMLDSVLNVTYNNTNDVTPTYHIVSESGGTAYPMYYNEKQNPPSSVTFATMDEALAYECPFVGLEATIGGDPYIFNAQYQWVPVT